MSAARRILVVDDQRPVAEMLLAVLRGEGFDVRVCMDPRLALQRAMAFAPDLIILDLVMPEVSGQDLLRSLREADVTARTPVLLMTAYHSAAEKLNLEPRNNVELMEKPFDIEDLVVRVRSLL